MGERDVMKAGNGRKVQVRKERKDAFSAAEARIVLDRPFE